VCKWDFTSGKWETDAKTTQPAGELVTLATGLKLIESCDAELFLVDNLDRTERELFLAFHFLDTALSFHLFLGGAD